MQSVTYRLDQSPVTPFQYQQDVEKYAGNIECSECEASAWFVRNSVSGGRERVACFAAHHLEGCQIKTVVLVVDDEGAEPDEGTDTTRINVDLDKRKPQEILVPEPRERQPVDSPWGVLQRKYANAADYPINKSLRQILSCLIKNSDYPEDDVSIRITTDGGRVALEGKSVSCSLISDSLLASSSVRFACSGASHQRQPEGWRGLAQLWGLPHRTKPASQR